MNYGMIKIIDEKSGVVVNVKILGSEVFFVAKDITKILNYRATKDVVKRFVSKRNRILYPFEELNGKNGNQFHMINKRGCKEIFEGTTKIGDEKEKKLKWEIVERVFNEAEKQRIYLEQEENIYFDRYFYIDKWKENKGVSKLIQKFFKI